MEPLELIKLGTPVLVLGMIVTLERLNTKVNAIQEDVRDIANNITWSGTCNARHDEINRRLDRLEEAEPR